jgi:hypothetical protein
MGQKPLKNVSCVIMAWSIEDNPERKALREQVTQIFQEKAQAKAIERAMQTVVNLYDLQGERIERSTMDKIVGEEYTGIFMGLSTKRGKVKRYSLGKERE